MMSGLRSQREYTITCVSLRSGWRRAEWFMAHQPAIVAAIDEQEDQEPVARREFDDAVDHLAPPS
jgi:hypothetical protein